MRPPGCYRDTFYGSIFQLIKINFSRRDELENRNSDLITSIHRKTNYGCFHSQTSGLDGLAHFIPQNGPFRCSFSSYLGSSLHLHYIYITSRLHRVFWTFSRFKNFHPSNFLWWVYKNHLLNIAYHSFLLSLFTKPHNFLSWSQPVQETGSYSTKNIFLSFTMCDNSFPNQSQLEIRPYICNNCRKSFKEEKNLKTHKLIHEGKTQNCKFCEKSFTQKGNLMSHYRTHSGEKPFSCEICEKTFTQLSHLKAHTRYHAGEKPFVCIICRKYFTQASNLIEHSKLHNVDTPLKSVHIVHNVDTPLKSVHSRGNSFLECNECGRKFTQTGNLKRHRRLHTARKTLDCNKCGKSFIRGTHLKEHKRVHRKVKPTPNACNECGKYLMQAGIFISHKLRCRCN